MYYLTNDIDQIIETFDNKERAIEEAKGLNDSIVTNDKGEEIWRHPKKSRYIKLTEKRLHIIKKLRQEGFFPNIKFTTKYGKKLHSTSSIKGAKHKYIVPYPIASLAIDRKEEMEEIKEALNAIFRSNKSVEEIIKSAEKKMNTNRDFLFLNHLKECA